MTAADPARFVTLERATAHGELCEALLLDVLDRLRSRLSNFKTLRAWANHYADHAEAKVRADAAATLRILDLLGED